MVLSAFGRDRSLPSVVLTSGVDTVSAFSGNAFSLVTVDIGLRWEDTARVELVMGISLTLMCVVVVVTEGPA